MSLAGPPSDNGDEAMMMSPSLIKAAAIGLPPRMAVKVCLVGLDVGKTSLAVRFAMDHFDMITDPTIEDHYYAAVTTRIDDVRVDVDLDILDVSSNYTTYGSLWPQWFNEADVFVLVYAVDSRDSYSLIASYYELVKRITRNESPLCVLVGTRLDRTQEDPTARQVRPTEGMSRGFLFGCPFFEASAKTGENVDKVFEAAVAEKVRDLKSEVTGEADPNRHETVAFDEAIMSDDEVAPVLADDNDVVHQGYLTKRGGVFKTWRKRWFVLTSETLSYYKSEKNGRAKKSPLGILRCRFMDLPVTPSAFDKDFCFDLPYDDDTVKRTYYFVAPDADAFDAWVEVITAVLQSQYRVFGVPLATLAARYADAGIPQPKPNAIPVAGGSSSAVVPRFTPLPYVELDGGAPPGRLIPFTLEKCVRALERRGCEDQPGLYRISGVKSHILALRRAFDTDELNVDPGLPDVEDINAIASAVKMYCTLLPEPLVPYASYEAVLQAAHIASSVAPGADDNGVVGRAVEAMASALADVPAVHYAVLKYLVSHLRLVADNADVNLMVPSNLGVVFGPTLLRKWVDPVEPVGGAATSTAANGGGGDDDNDGASSSVLPSSAVGRLSMANTLPDFDLQAMARQNSAVEFMVEYADAIFDQR